MGGGHAIEIAGTLVGPRSIDVDALVAAAFRVHAVQIAGTLIRAAACYGYALTVLTFSVGNFYGGALAIG